VESGESIAHKKYTLHGCKKEIVQIEKSGKAKGADECTKKRNLTWKITGGLKKSKQERKKERFRFDAYCLFSEDPKRGGVEGRSQELKGSLQGGVLF